MIARLWWKEARLFWPIWVFLGLTALAVQGGALYLFGSDVRGGVLGVFALGWACLYGCAAASAAIAGEREHQTLALLDRLGLDRAGLWRGKASFAIVSTFALAAVLFGCAALTTEHWETQGAGLALAVVGAVAVLLEVLGWGLFWSAALSNPLIAAILTLCSLVVVPILTQHLDGMRWFVNTAPTRLAVALATTAASYALVVANAPGRSRRRRARRVVLLTDSASDSPALEGGSTHSWRTAARSLVWQSVREARPVWLWLAGLFTVATVLAALLDDPRNVFGFIAALSWPAGVVAGVNVFGVENRARTYRFLVHHGVRPGLVWAVKVGVWVAGLVVLWLLITLISPREWVVSPLLRRQETPAIAVLMILAMTLSVGMLCGMTIRRGLTAGVVAAAVLVVTLLPLIPLFHHQMVPIWGVATIPLTCLLVSWAWSADWMYERPGAGRWVRLGLLISGAVAATFGGYVTYRIASVPVPDAVALARYARPVESTPASGAPGNAADVYAEALKKLHTPVDDASPGENDEALTLVRRAAKMSLCRFVDADQSNLFNGISHAEYVPLTDLVARSARSRREKGDLAGAWDDLMVLFRMARHFSGDARAIWFLQGLQIERQALDLAVEWAADTRQTPERLKAALDAFNARPALPTAAEMVAAEAEIADRTLQLPREKLIEFLSGTGRKGREDPQGYSAATARFWAGLIATPWEVARARRGFRLLFSAEAAQAALDPSERRRPDPDVERWVTYIDTVNGQAGLVATAADLDWVHHSTPLVTQLFPNLTTFINYNDRNEVSRRALTQILALRLWQVRHDGRLPESLDLLLTEGGGLDGLPKDPYSNHYFHYVPSQGQEALPFSLSDIKPGRPLHESLRSTEGSRLLYSIGDDRIDQNADWGSDIVFPLPDKPGAIPKPPATPPDAIPGGMIGGMSAGMMEIKKDEEPSAPPPDTPPDGPPQ